MTARRTQSLLWVYILYGISVIGMTVFLLYGRPPIMDRNVTWAEIILLAPGIILYLPLLLLSGGIHWSILPLWARMPLWGALNILGYLAIPVGTRVILALRREWNLSGKQGNFWLGLIRRPAVLVAAGVLCTLLGLNGVLQISWKISGPTDYANAVLGPVAAIGLWCLAYYLYRYGTVTGYHGKVLPAWTHWAVALVALIGGVIGGRLAYGEAKILRWTKASAGTLAISVTGVTLLMVWIAWRTFQKHRQP